MKAILTTFTVFILFSGISQDYAPFYSASSKRFCDVENPSDDHYFFYADDTNYLGDTTVFNQYRKIVQTSDYTDYCGFWGSASGLFLDTTWLGTQLKWNPTTKELSLKNRHNEIIHFDFGIPIGASAQFYANNVIEYRIEHTNAVLNSFYNLTDSIEVFEIQTFDSVGSAIPSSLNGFEIKLSKNYGLLSFINCYQLPDLEQKFELRGNTHPDFGAYSLTKDAVYPWQAGDQLQYRNARLGPGASQHNYQMLTVTDRVETADSVWIYLSSALIEPSPVFGGPFNHQRSAQPIIYRKGSFVSYVPTNRSNYDVAPFGPAIFQTEWINTTFCSDTLKTQSTFGRFLFLCDICQCYGDSDGNSTSTESKTYLENFGVSSSRYEPYGYMVNGTGLGSELIYASVNGMACGNLWADVNEIETFNFEISPNPTNDLVSINCEFQIEEITIRDFSGRTILALSDINQNETTISLGDLQSGAYIVEVQANNSVQKKTIFKE